MVKTKKIQQENQIDNFLFQISTNNISRYFNYGIILPVKYIGEKNRTTDDIQNEFSEFLVLTKGKYAKSKVKQYILEITILKKETKYLQETSTNGVFLFDKPLPISRVSSIYYNSEKDKEDTLSTVKVGSDSNIPDHLFEKMPKLKKIINFKSKVKNYVNKNNYEKKINEFDKIMGMYCYVRNAKLLYNKNKINQNHEILCLISNNFNDEHSANINQSKSKFFDKLLKRNHSQKDLLSEIVINIYDKDKDFNLDLLKSLIEKHRGDLKPEELVKKEANIKKSQELYKHVEKYIKDPDVNAHHKILQKAWIESVKIESDKIKDKIENKTVTLLDRVYNSLGKSLEKQNRFKWLNSDRGLQNYFYATYITEYGAKRSNSKHNLINSILEEVPEDLIENILALMGIYFGYYALPVSVAINKNENPINIKFNLDSRFDKLIIEAIYQFVVNELKDQDFEHITHSGNESSEDQIRLFRT